MLDLVLWSFIVALTPSPPCLAWKLIEGSGDLPGFGLTSYLDDARRIEPL